MHLGLNLTRCIYFIRERLRFRGRPFTIILGLYKAMTYEIVLGILEHEGFHLCLSMMRLSNYIFLKASPLWDLYIEFTTVNLYN